METAPVQPVGATDAGWPPAPASALRNRLVALLILVPALAVLGLAAWLNPDPAGVGTHEQLGLNPCSTLEATGYPCPTCGMTTAFSHAAHGQFVASFLTQPAGAVLALITACAAVIAGYSLVVGVSLDRLIVSCWAPRPMLILGVIVVLGWVYKIVAIRGGF